MEPIQIFDATNNKEVNVFVEKEIAQRCRLDANFAAELIRQIEEQNVEEGSTIEIETVADIQTSTADALPEKELWSRTETLKFLKLYQKYYSKYGDKKKFLWRVISKELERRNILKPPERCRIKWKNLIRTYRSAKERNNINRFHYYRAVDNLLNGKTLILSDTDSEIESYDEELINTDSENLESRKQLEKESWTCFETMQLLKAYQNAIKQNYPRTKLWKFISTELTKDEIFKTPQKCTIKWKNLYRSYKSVLERDDIIPGQKFKFFKEVDDLVNKRYVELSDVQSDTQEESDFYEIVGYNDSSINPNKKLVKAKEDIKIGTISETVWSEEEIAKLLWAYKKLKNKYNLNSNKGKFWTIISEELENSGLWKNPTECEYKINCLYRDKLYVKDLTTDVATIDEIPNHVEKSTVKLEKNDSELFSKDQGDDTVYEKIIIESEEPENIDSSYKDDSWKASEVLNLISLCSQQMKNTNSRNFMDSFWETISTDLSTCERYRSPDECKTKWEDMISTYETCKNLNLEWKNNSIFDKIDDVFNKIGEANSRTENNLDQNCKCQERHLLAKQKRHSERMELLKRKLEIEERKVKAFEEYVKYIKR